MAKLYFRYGAMGSSKTANALMVRYNYQEQHYRPVLLKPALENRDGVREVRSRVGLSAECRFVEEYLEEVERNGRIDDDVVIVDEVQFLTANDIDRLSDLVDQYGVTVICYGLRTDFSGHFFEGTRRLMEIADAIEELPTICWCGKKAHFNARVWNGKMVTSGEQIVMGGNELYLPLCRKHFKMRKIKKED